MMDTPSSPGMDSGHRCSRAAAVRGPHASGEPPEFTLVILSLGFMLGDSPIELGKLRTVVTTRQDQRHQGNAEPNPDANQDAQCGDNVQSSIH
jgi:hypothetical protein